MPSVARFPKRLPARSRHSETLEDEVWTDWYECPLGLAQGQLPALGSSRPGDTRGCWGFTLAEIDTAVKDGGETYTVMVWRNPKRLDANTQFSEILRIPEWTVPRRTGLRVFLAPNKTAEATIRAGNSLWGVWPGDATLLPVRVRCERNWRKGLARVTVLYETMPLEVIAPEKGKIYVRIGGEARTLNWDLSDPALPIEAVIVAADKKSRYCWTVYRGSNVVLAGSCELLLVVQIPAHSLYDAGAAQTAYAALLPGGGGAAGAAAGSGISIAAWKGLVGKYNSGACPHIANSPAKTLKFLGAEMDPGPGNANYVVGRFHLAYDENGWDQSCECEKQVFEVREEKVLDADGVDTHQTARRGEWVSQTPPETAYRKTALPGSFATLDRYMA